MKRLIVLSCLCLASRAGAVTVPPGFVAHQVASSGSWEEIVGMAFAPDGRLFVIERRGRVWIVENNVKRPEPFLSLEDEVLNNGDRGLLGIALDPDFDANGFVYLLYTVDPDGDGIDDEGPSFGRLVRYRESSIHATGADLASRRILIGRSWSDGIPAIYNTHGPGSLRFGSDGTLLVSAGEAAHADTPDGGGRDSRAFGDGKFPESEDIGAFRSQWLGSLAGKILRVDPATGDGLPSNPYYNGDPGANVSRVWAYGLRNPYRFCVRPGTGSADPSRGRPGTLFIGDVGWKTWEEVSVALGGENFGWPCREGPIASEPYVDTSPDHHGCGTIGMSENPAPATRPLLSWHHDDSRLSNPPPLVGKCVAGVAFYTGSNYPALYRGACFIAEYDRGWIRAARVDSSNGLIEVLDFATDAAGPVDIAADPVSGDLFYVSILRNEIRRIRYDTSNRPPGALASATPSSGGAPLAVQFSSEGTSDPDGDPVTYHWAFGDGASSMEPAPLHVYNVAGDHTATLTADDGRGGQGSASVTITVAGGDPRNRPPAVTISEPHDRSHFMPLARLALAGSATDDGDPPESLRYSWEVILHHNTHIHPGWLYLEGAAASFIPEDHDDGTGVFLELVLRATDSGGATGSARVYIHAPDDTIIIDDGDPGTSSTGSWSSSPAPYPHREDSLYSKTPGSSYTYDFDLPAPGPYRVFAWWTFLKTRATSVPFDVTHALGTSTVLVNQADPDADGLWNDLGTYEFEGAGRVTITALESQLSTSADAIAILPPVQVRPPIAWIDDISPGPAIIGDLVTFRGRGEGDSPIAAYRWTSNRDGLLADRREFMTDGLSPGFHVIFFRVTDEAGLESNDAKAVIQINPLPAADLIIDDGSIGASSSGAWRASTAPGAYGGASLYSKKAGDAFSWTALLPAAAVYDVYAWWTSFPNRTNMAPYEIHHAAGSNVVKANQRLNGSRWVHLGTFSFGGSARVDLTSPGNGVSTSADAVRLVYRRMDRILDDGDPGTSFIGSWAPSGGRRPFGGGSLYSRALVGAYTYDFELREPGEYEVLAWWSVTSARSRSVPYEIIHSSGATTVHRDQLERGGRWNSLGAYSFGSQATVRVLTPGDGGSAAADAILLRRL